MRPTRPKSAKRLVAGLAAALAVPLASFTVATAPLPPVVGASSHREAPLITQDPRADGTDFYMFPSPEDNGTVTFVADYIPLEVAYAGPNFYSFDPDVLYAVKVDNNGDNTEDITYELRFRSEVRNGNTFLYNTGPIESLDDPDWNVRQFYTLTRVDGSGRRDLVTDAPVPPANIGPKSTPDYASLAAAAIRPLPGGGQVFAGPRDDPFFADLGSLFDLLSIRKLPGNAGGGVDGLAGHNVHSIVLQVPTAQLSANGQQINKGDLGNPNAVIGAWTTASRPKMRVLDPGKQTSSGDMVQVSRLGNPLVNEVVIPLAVKDAFNAISPSQDVPAGALPLVQDPEPARLLKALYNVNVPPAPRTDLVAVFLTGIPGSVLGLPGGTAPMNVPAGAQTGSEMMRLNMGTPPTAIGAGNRLGALGGDVTGYPNGRRLADDVVDISLRAVAGATYPLTTPGFVTDPLVGQLGDGVDGNDKAFMPAFPYLATPWQGYDANTAAPFPFVRCATGRIYSLTSDGSIGQYVPDPAIVGMAPVLEASAAFPRSWIDMICGSGR
jgi:Domain of unknown function (DUF4331)